ncbi:organic cation transporter protein-like [Diadema antillarum]|uniref:organic cation transporter protein-like n=1 Tax=Diadema antillarum TaxID=105358 RepID=UPI003A838EBA
MVKVDDILMEIGEFGPFQWRVFAIVCFVVFTNPWVSIIAVFLNASMDHWCTFAKCMVGDLAGESVGRVRSHPTYPSPPCDAHALQHDGTSPLIAETVILALLIYWIGLIFFLPESLRWQIAARDFNKAEKTLSKIAETNKKHLNRPVFSQEFIKERMSAPKERRRNGLDIFRTPKMRLRSINLIFIWMVNSMVYHGLSLNSSNLGVNIYLAFAVAGAVEIPAYLLAVPVINTAGRRPGLAGCMLLGGLACLCTSFIPPGVALSVVAMVGKFGITASYGIIYLYTAELYPTEIRSVGVGTCSMFARVAGILAPLILALRKIWTPLPLVLYGSVSVLAGLLCLMLPETRGQKLPETMSDGENFGKSVVVHECANNVEESAYEIPDNHCNETSFSAPYGSIKNPNLMEMDGYELAGALVQNKQRVEKRRFQR